jgi:anti-sigma factor RsiW
MSANCPTSFDETLISGFLDGELTQADEQRVRIHLEDCDHCREIHDGLAAIREATMSTHFVKEPDRQWDERPQGAASRTGFTLGWIVAILWLIATCGYAGWQIWIDTEGWFEKTLIFSGVAAAGLLFTSVLIDRLRNAKTDRYRKVEK